MIRRVFLAGVMTLAANQAAGLSCVQPDVARSFNLAAAAQTQYSVLVGTFVYDPTQPPDGGDMLSRLGYDIAAQFSGQGLGANAFGEIEPIDVTIQIECVASWCGAPPPLDEPTLAFVERTETGYVLRADACNGSYFAPVQQSQIAQVESCMRGTGCTELFGH